MIYPPIAKASEAPCGLALLAGALNSHQVPCQVLDMNLGAQEYLLNKYFKEHPKKEHYRHQIRDEKTYRNLQQYKRCVFELNKGLGAQNQNRVSLANYTDSELDPLSSADLIACAENYQESPFYLYYHKELSARLQEGTITHIGISLQFINQAAASFALIGYLKAEHSEVKIVAGGGLINSWTSLQSWNNPFDHWIDTIICGKGEEKLLRYLGIEPDAQKLKQAVPDYSWIKEQHYFSPGMILPFAASQGCSWRRCKFCPELAEENSYSTLKSDQVIEQLLQMKDEYHPALIHFMDNEISPALLSALGRSTLQTPWYGFTRFYKQLKDKEYCIALKDSGCTMLKLGLESGDQEVLNALDKGVNLEDVPPILQNLKEAGIKTFVYILLGTPVEDYNSARKTLDFIVKHAPYINYLNVAIYNQPIGSREFALEKEFSYSTADLSLYRGFEHPKGWNRGTIRKFLKDEFNHNSKIREILNRTPPQFGANHGAFFI